MPLTLAFLRLLLRRAAILAFAALVGVLVGLVSDASAHTTGGPTPKTAHRGAVGGYEVGPATRVALRFVI